MRLSASPAAARYIALPSQPSLRPDVMPWEVTPVMMDEEMLQHFKDALHAVEPQRAAALPELTLDLEVAELGLDSLTMMETIGYLEEKLNFEFPDEELALREIPAYRSLPRHRQEDQRRALLAWMLSQFLHGGNRHITHIPQTSCLGAGRCHSN